MPGKNDPYHYVPDRHLVNDKTKIYWDEAKMVDQAVQHSKSDIPITENAHKQNKTKVIVNTAVPNDENFEKLFAEKVKNCLLQR